MIIAYRLTEVNEKTVSTIAPFNGAKNLVLSKKGFFCSRQI